jgi:translation initiation factor 1
MNRNKLFFSVFGVATLLIGCSKPDSNIASENATKTAIADDAKEKMDAAREKLKEALDAWVSSVSYKQYEKDHYNVNFADSEYKGGKVLMRYEIGAFQITKTGYEVAVTKVFRSQTGDEARGIEVGILRIYKVSAMGKDDWRKLLCPNCHQLKTTCTCHTGSSIPSQSTVVRVGRETKGRRGKGVTTIMDLPLNENGLAELAAKLKQQLGTGGTVKDGHIEIQGDLRDRIVAELEVMGYRVKRAGG